MKRILVTGATGFVGRALIPLLLDKGWNVSVALRTARSQSDFHPAIRQHVVGEINGNTDWTNVLTDVDVVVHLAARVHVMRDQEADPLEAYRSVNVEGTKRLIEACVMAGVQRFVFMSSVKAVGEGNRNGKPYSETDPPEPIDPYGISKLEAEEVVNQVFEKSAMETVILRPPMVYGPGVKANMRRLMRGVQLGLPFPLASVKNLRSMIYVMNLADAVVACVERPEAAGQVFFVSDDEHLSTPELVAELAHLMGKKPRLFPIPTSLLRVGATLFGLRNEIDRLTESLVVDTSRIKETLGWSPPWSVHDGLRETVRSYLDELGR